MGFAMCIFVLFEIIVAKIHENLVICKRCGVPDRANASKI
jgi:hypothetical protein